MSRSRSCGWRSGRRCALAALLTLLPCVSLAAADEAAAWRVEADRRIEAYRKTDLVVVVRDAAGEPVPGATVRVAMRRHAFGFGTAVTAGWINHDSPRGETYREKLLENFNHVVFENDMKFPMWLGLHGDGFNWESTSRALDWLEANGLPARGHYLSWTTWSDDNAWGDSQDTATLPDRVLDHIADLLTTVGPRVFEWDVINHPIGWQNDTYENRIGDGAGGKSLDFYARIIDHAREVIDRPLSEGGLGGARLPLWINEDDVIAGGARADDYERVIKHLIDRGSAPDGIGFQAHFVQEWGRVTPATVTPESLYERIDRFADLLPRLRVTEFDIDIGDNAERHAELLGDYLTVMFSHPRIEAVTMWGFWAGAHWRPNAALYRRDWTERPALAAYRRLVFDRWWTEVTAVSDAAGVVRLRGFKGEYEIAASHADSGGAVLSARVVDPTRVEITLADQTAADTP